MKERIQKILSSRGLMSRRAAEELLHAGRITCNGIPCALGDQADPAEDCILVDGLPLPEERERVYLMLNKPRGVVTSLADERGRLDVSSLVAGCGRRVWPVGRLDRDSEGLLLFTDDGALSNRLTHPRHEVNKVYEVTVSGYVPEKERLLARPIVLDGRRIHPPKVLLRWARNGRALLEITIHEGRNRQVRRMCSMAGMTVLRLCRIEEDGLRLDGLEPGKWRYLRRDELRILDVPMKEDAGAKVCKEEEKQ